MHVCMYVCLFVCMYVCTCHFRSHVGSSLFSKQLERPLVFKCSSVILTEEDIWFTQIHAVVRPIRYLSWAIAAPWFSRKSNGTHSFRLGCWKSGGLEMGKAYLWRTLLTRPRESWCKSQGYAVCSAAIPQSFEYLSCVGARECHGAHTSCGRISHLFRHQCQGDRPGLHSASS